MSVKCGHCHERHDNIDAVMICASQHGFRVEPRKPVTVEAVQEELDKPGPLWGWNDGRPVRPVKPSEQRREEKRWSDIGDVNKIGATVPVGRYALQNQGGGANSIQFYHVERPDKGEWAGKTFVRQQLGPAVERIPMAQQRAALLRIAADPAGASQLYGRKLGICGVCGSPLTNEDSRAYGIGPVCRKNMGY
jgi:Family of unknown function (DUF6011)